MVVRHIKCTVKSKVSFQLSNFGLLMDALYSTILRGPIAVLENMFYKICGENCKNGLSVYL